MACKFTNSKRDYDHKVKKVQQIKLHVFVMFADTIKGVHFKSQHECLESLSHLLVA